MTKQLTLDEMLDCLITINHPTARISQAIIEATGTIMADTIATALGITAGPATFEGTAFAGTCAPFAPAFPDQPCPAPLSLYDPKEWATDDPTPTPEPTVLEMPQYIVETTYRKPFYRHRVYKASTPEDACQQALADTDYEGEKPDDETAGTPYITGIWSGEDTAYKGTPLPIPAHYTNTVQENADNSHQSPHSIHNEPELTSTRNSWPHGTRHLDYMGQKTANTKTVLAHPWEALTESEREADREIGTALWLAGREAGQ